MINTILDLLSDIPTALPSENRPYSVARMRRVVHMHMRLSLWSLNGSD
jgi:hypothetical protein